MSAGRKTNGLHKPVNGDWGSLLSLGAEKQPQKAPYTCENVLRVHRVSFYNKPGFFYCQGKKDWQEGKNAEREEKGLLADYNM